MSRRQSAPETHCSSSSSSMRRNQLRTSAACRSWLMSEPHGAEAMPLHGGDELLGGYGGSPSAQDVLLDLAGGCLGQLVDEADGVGALEVGQAIAGELLQLVFGHGD